MITLQCALTLSASNNIVTKLTYIVNAYIIHLYNFKCLSQQLLAFDDIKVWIMLIIFCISILQYLFLTFHYLFDGTHTKRHLISNHLYK